MKLEEITNGASLEGVEPSIVVTVVAAIPIPPDSLQLVYRLADGTLRERLLSRADEASLRVATVSRPWSFDGDGAAFQLTAEAKRIDFAFLFDPMMAEIDFWTDRWMKLRDGRQPDALHIEVKGRVKGATTITVTRNEMLYALNQAEKFRLAMVFVGESDTVEGPFYLKNPFMAEPGWGVSSINFDIKALIERAEKL